MAFIKTVNAEGGSDARYDVNAATPEERRFLDDEGRPLVGGSDSLPGQWDWTEGLPGARGGSGPGFFEGLAGGGGGGGGGGLDAYTAQLKSYLEAQSAAQRADTRAFIQQALISSGFMPQNFQDEFGALDDTTRALIEKNNQTGISGYARLLEEKGDRQRSILSQLSTKGLRRSGAKGFLGRRAQLDWDRKSMDAISALQTAIGGKKREFADAESQRQLQLMQALFSKQFATPYSGGGRAAPGSQSYRAPAPTREAAINYWQSNPAPTYTSPTTGQQWYGGVNGYESTPFKGKALDSLMG